MDHQLHDIGSGGAFKTPTLLNANFNGPYFHDGRYANYAQVVAHFDREFYLGFSTQDRRDLVAYLQAVGDGEQPTQPTQLICGVKEISDFMAVLDSAISEHDAQVVGLATDTIDRELRDLSESFPEPRNTTVTGGAASRSSPERS